MSRALPRAAVLLPSIWLLLHVADAQISTRVGAITPAEATSSSPLVVTAELLQGEVVERTYFLFRLFGESEWTRLEMNLVGNTASVILPSPRVVQPFIEYYLVLQKRSGDLETYPFSESRDPFFNPPLKTLQIPVRAKDEDFPQVIFLSPEPKANVAPEDVTISVSLLRADSVVVRRATQLFLDGIDVTLQSVIAEDMIVHVPEKALTPGMHKVTVVLYNRQGKLHRTANLIFNVTGTLEETGASPVTEPGYSASFDIETRREKVNEVKTWYNRGGLQFNGRMDEWRLVTNLFLTSDEQSDRQPQNRFYGGVESPWLRVGFGDAYPIFSNLILNGKRVRGLTGAVRLGFFNLDVTWGKTIRGVDGRLLKSIPAADLAAEQLVDPNAAYAQIDPATWGKFSYGTYERNLFAIRPSFGSGKSWQLGFTWLKAKDEIGSIRYGVRPQENFVVGTDLVARFDDNRLEFTAQGAFSAYNGDISSGNFTDAYIDSVYKERAAAIKNARDILKDFITVNDNLRPLSLKKLSTVAYDVALGLNYFDNALKFAYLFRGSDYNSFGQTFLRTDVKGFNITDRIRLVDNQVFLSLGYERLTDNLSDSKPATTTFTTLNAALSYYPRAEVPSFTVGWSRFANVNDVPAAGPVAFPVDDQTNRFFIQSSYRFASLAQHTGSLSISTSNRDDYSIRRANIHNVSLSLGLTTQYLIPLQTTLEYTLNLNSLPFANAPPGVVVDLNYSTMTMGARYRLFNDALHLNAAISPSFGDFRRIVLDFGTQWYIMPTMSLLAQYSYLGNQLGPNDDFMSLRLRYDL